MLEIVPDKPKSQGPVFIPRGRRGKGVWLPCIWKFRSDAIVGDEDSRINWILSSGRAEIKLRARYIRPASKVWERAEGLKSVNYYIHKGYSET